MTCFFENIIKLTEKFHLTYETILQIITDIFFKYLNDCQLSVNEIPRKILSNQVTDDLQIASSDTLCVVVIEET